MTDENEKYNLSKDRHICIDCVVHNGSTLDELRGIPKGGYCKHFQPDWWVKQGWVRNWGDAAVMAFPTLEILRREQTTSPKCQFLILCPALRRPVIITCNDSKAWGSF